MVGEPTKPRSSASAHVLMTVVRNGVVTRPTPSRASRSRTAASSPFGHSRTSSSSTSMKPSSATRPARRAPAADVTQIPKCSPRRGQISARPQLGLKNWTKPHSRCSRRPPRLPRSCGCHVSWLPWAQRPSANPAPRQQWGSAADRRPGGPNPHPAHRPRRAGQVRPAGVRRRRWPTKLCRTTVASSAQCGNTTGSRQTGPHLTPELQKEWRTSLARRGAGAWSGRDAAQLSCEVD